MLRSELGEQFVGGFIPSAFARRHYPDLIVCANTNAAGYARKVREATIGISTVGLHGSNPWKLVEYLAAGQAIVSQRLRSDLPYGLEGVGKTIFADDVESLVAEVLGLVADPDRTYEMRVASRRYFLEHVHPARVVARTLCVPG
jgi:hypothetical protein